MTKYIDRDAALTKICEYCVEANGGICEHKCADYCAIAKLPAADVENVVRCADCLYWQKDADEDIADAGRCRWAKYMVSASNYCSFGIKKKG